MAESPDLFARLLGAASFSVALYALWLNRQKNERDLAAQKPQFAISADRRGVRLWRVTVTVTNPRPVPISWRKVEIIYPRGGLLANMRAKPLNHDPKWPVFAKSDLAKYFYVEGYPVRIGPSETSTWEGWATIDDWYGLGKNDGPFIVPIIDGYDLRPSLFRRLASWIWPKAIKM